METDKDTAASGERGLLIDPKSVLLPKKEGAVPASTERVNAGILLEQETSAKLGGTAQNPPEQKSGASVAEGNARTPRTFAPGGSAESVPQKKEESAVRPIETYQGDIESLVQNKNLSVVSIAAAEAIRRSHTPHAAPEASSIAPATEWLNWLGGRLAMVMGGVFFFAAAAGLLAYFFLRPVPSVPPNTAADAPFILVDDTRGIAFAEADFTRPIAMGAFNDMRKNVALSLGLIERIYPATMSTNADGVAVYTLIDAQKLLALLGPTAPQELVRTVEPAPYLFGAHVFDDHQAFLMLTVDSYEQAFAGMLGWEATMQSDLAPLFTRTPRPHIPEEGLATSTPEQRAIVTGFTDVVVENHDARVIKNEYGDILLLWTFLDRSTLLITTNEYTLREIVSRISNAPVR
ncbi:hypothetical protein HYS79_00775 [Patescibacteria group bacterium]|nr:hypothetical protein [Patescibacteria group bacterium]